MHFVTPPPHPASQARFFPNSSRVPRAWIAHGLRMETVSRIPIGEQGLWESRVGAGSGAKIKGNICNMALRLRRPPLRRHEASIASVLSAEAGFLST